MSGTGSFSSKLTAKQQEFIETLIHQHYISDAAEGVGISYRTAHRWMQLPQVIEAIETQRQELREAVSRRLITCMELATEYAYNKLHRAVYPREGHYCDSKTANYYVTLMFKYAADRREVDDLKSRIKELEAQVHAGSLARLQERDTMLHELTDEELEVLEKIAQRLEMNGRLITRGDDKSGDKSSDSPTVLHLKKALS